MKKTIVVMLAIISLATMVEAKSRFSTDQFGNTRGTINGQRYRSHTDQFGNTRGTIGGKSFRCHTDSWGNTRCN